MMIRGHNISIYQCTHPRKQTPPPSLWPLQLAYDPTGLAAKYGVDIDVDVDVDGLDGDSCDSDRDVTKGEVPLLIKRTRNTLVQHSRLLAGHNNTSGSATATCCGQTERCKSIEIVV